MKDETQLWVERLFSQAFSSAQDCDWRRFSPGLTASPLHEHLFHHIIDSFITGALKSGPAGSSWWVSARRRSRLRLHRVPS